jgi:hypothetical protein
MKSKEQHLHIISFDIPYPPNYGGVIDVFYKIKSLHQLGVKIHLHCFEYGRKESDSLTPYCEKINYYKRNTAKSQLFNRLPYIIISRASEELLKNLLNDDWPILFEGLHCCYFLSDARLKNRFKLVRTHNVEHDYYQSLARVEKDIFKRYYFYNESGKLEAFEPTLQNANYIAAISLNDTNYFQYRFKNARYIPAFHSNESIKCKPGKGNYALYHGNLSIGENNEAALYLVDVFTDSEFKLVVAGNKPSKELRDAVAKRSNIELQADVSIDELNFLITEAHINILPTFQPTGIKLKLLTALFNGRHCLVNDVMVANTNLENLCHIAHNADEFKKQLKKLFKKDFAIQELERRIKILHENFSNEASAKKLLDLLK